MYVDRAFRGSGVAALLLTEAERQIAAAGHDVAFLVVVRGNDRAQAFYARQGWTDEGDVDYPVPGARRGLHLAVPEVHQARALTQTCSREATAAATRSMASSIGTPLSWWPSR